MDAFALGIDIGGTFTDVVAFNRARGKQINRKVLTVTDDPADSVIEGILNILQDNALSAKNCDRLVHATTLFTNALIERKGAKTGLLTTRGFRDTLEIGRERKYELYNLAITKPEVLVPRHRRLEVTERVDATGQILMPLNKNELLELAKNLVEDGVESLAVVFLHSYINPLHEREALALLKTEYPNLSVSISSEVAPEIREYERTSTTVVNAYIKPLAESYLDRLAEQIQDLDIEAPLHLMLSAGGLTHLEQAKRNPVQMLESGPAAGVLAAAFFGERSLIKDNSGDLLAFDMGGTTAKVAMIEEGMPRTCYSFEAARQNRFTEGSGLPIQISTVELIEIGAGGGSIAYLDALGLLKVGPKSAGSKPGPASYGFGGVEPTVTDADFALGYLAVDSFADGDVVIDRDAGLQALAGLAEEAELDVITLASGIHDVVNENMACAARVHIAEQGRDPRDFTLICTGGAGPVHAFGIAKKLGIKQVLCPSSAGVASALGLLVAPARVDKVATIGFSVQEDNLKDLEASFKGLEEDALAVLAETKLPTTDVVNHRLVDGRFKGQGFDLVVELPSGPYDTSNTINMRDLLSDSFKNAYRQRFNRTPPDVPIEFINARVKAHLSVPGANQVLRISNNDRGDGRVGERIACFPDFGGMVATAVYDRRQMAVGTQLNGPVIVVETGSTLVIGPGWQAKVLENGNIIAHLPDIEGER